MAADERHRGLVGGLGVELGGQAGRKRVIGHEAGAGNRASTSARRSVAAQSGSVWPGT